MTSPMASLNTFAWGRWLKWPFMAVVALQVVARVCEKDLIRMKLFR